MCQHLFYVEAYLTFISKYFKWSIYEAQIYSIYHSNRFRVEELLWRQHGQVGDVDQDIQDDNQRHSDIDGTW